MAKSGWIIEVGNIAYSLEQKKIIKTISYIADLKGTNVFSHLTDDITKAYGWHYKREAKPYFEEVLKFVKDNIYTIPFSYFKLIKKG